MTPAQFGRCAAALATAAAAALAGPHALAQDNYPSKPITIVVPYPAGGSNDVFARIVGKALSDSLKATVIIDNRPGASGNTGAGQVAKAAPDGYTLVAVSSRMTTNAAIQSKLPFDPIKSFAPVAMFAKGPFSITSLKPNPIAPDLTPMGTAVPGYEFELWWGLLAPAGTPPAIVNQLNAEVNKVLASPEIKAAFLKEGAEAAPLTPAQFAGVIAADTPRWQKIAQQQNIVAE